MKSNKQKRGEIKIKRSRNKDRDTFLSSKESIKKFIETAPCNPVLLAPYNSYGNPEFVARGFYVSKSFKCKDCNKEEIWTATQQKWWYEIAKGNVESTAIRCRKCRSKDRERRSESRRIHLEGLKNKAKEK